MIIINVQKKYLKEILFSQLRNTMNLQLYVIDQSSVWLYSYLGKKIFGEYYHIETGQLIPKRKWAKEMKFFFQEEKKKIQPQKSTFRLKWLGFILLISPFIGIGYERYQHYKMKSRNENLSQQPAIGNIYYGYKINWTNANTTYIWAKVTRMIGDTMIIQFSKLSSKDFDVVDKTIPSDFDIKEYKYIMQRNEYTPTFKSIETVDNFIPISKK